MSRAQVAALSLADTDKSLIRLTVMIRESAERRLERRLSDEQRMRLCRHCPDGSSMVDAVSGESLCPDHAAAFAYYGRVLVPIEAFLPERLS